MTQTQRTQLEELAKWHEEQKQEWQDEIAIRKASSSYVKGNSRVLYMQGEWKFHRNAAKLIREVLAEELNDLKLAGIILNKLEEIEIGLQPKTHLDCQATEECKASTETKE